MSTQSRVISGAACIVLLVLACVCAGCYSTPAQTPSAPALPAPAAGTNAITIKNFAFSPATLTVKTGTTVTWTNDDSSPHRVVSDDGAPVAFTSPSLATGASYPFTFSQAGTYAYHCSIHPSMKGTIVVQP
jgi:plastocyanin